MKFKSFKNSHHKQLSTGLKQNNPSIFNDLPTERENGEHLNKKVEKLSHLSEQICFSDASFVN